MYKRIVRNMTFGEPVVIGVRPKPKPEPESEEIVDEPESEAEPEPERGIPPEMLDKVFAEIAEIERKTQLTEETLRDAESEKAKAEELRRQSEELRKQAEELNKQAEQTKQRAQSLRDEAKKIRDDAKVEADKIVADTKLDAEKLLDKVRKEGYDNGHREGKEQGIKDGKEHIEAELKDIVRQANDKAQKTIRDAKEQTAEYFIRAEDEIVAVVMMAIEKILPQHFLDVPQVVLPVVREAISHVRDQREIKIHVEPDSYDLILMARAEFQSMLTDGTAIIEVISDEALKPGDCVIETPNGGVDARLSTRLEILKNAVESVLNNREAIHRV